ncbi:MAG: hypothetical protein FGM24_06960 [Candidatus Kapabacteria bacterium]|nr:hypothetical protein [Candidatus Kapabacteria bacterium]
MMKRFLIVMLTLTSVMSAQRRPTYHVGSVNNDTIKLETFSQDVGRRLELASMAGSTTEAQVIERAWNDYVRQSLIRQEAAARKIVVTATDVDNMLLSDPPAFVRQGFADEKGKFLPDVLRATLSNPDSLLRAQNPKASAGEIRMQTAELRQTMNELRAQVQSIMLEQRLRNAVIDSLPVDSNALRRTHAEVSSSCTADVVYLPCAASTTQASDLELRAWYTREQHRYIAQRPMRKLALLTFSLRPSAMDTADFMKIASDMTAMWKKASPQIRKGIVDGFTKQSGVRTATIAKDDAQLAAIFEAATTHREGDMFGPIFIGASSYYVILDKAATKQRPSIDVRMLRMPTQMSPQRKDSVMRAVDEAMRMYEGGAELGEVAARHKAALTVTRWLTAADSIRGSYKIVDLAFATQIGAACDPVETPEQSIVVAVVADSVDAGQIPFEKVIDDVRAEVLRDRACIDRARAAASMKALCTRLDDGLMVIAEQMQGMTVQRDVTIERAGTIAGEVMDTTLAAAVYKEQRPGLIGPVMGSRGWYVVNIQSIVRESPQGFATWLASSTGKDMVEIYREAAWQKYLYDLEQRATITDNRWMYFNY